MMFKPWIRFQMIKDLLDVAKVTLKCICFIMIVVGTINGQGQQMIISQQFVQEFLYIMTKFYF